MRGFVCAIAALVAWGTPFAPADARSAAPLVPPPGFHAKVQQQSGKREFDCKQPPAPFTGDLEFPSKYQGSDKARDDFNAKAYRIYKTKTEPITALEKQFSSLVDKYMNSGDPRILDCALTALGRWAEAKALLGNAENHTGKAIRKWALASFSSAYLRLKFSKSRPLAGHADRSELIEAWLEDLAKLVVKEWDKQPLAKMNNHEYWAAWAVMASAVILDRRDLYDWAIAQYRIAAGQVDEDGYLPNELRRQTRALAYHNYALGPLAMIAAFAKANGLNVAREGDGALERLATRVLVGLDDPGVFEARTGDKQKLEDLDSSSKFAWLEPFCWTVPCKDKVRERVAALRPLKTYRLGGNVTRLFEVERKRAAPRPATSSGTAVGRLRSDPNPSRSQQGEPFPWMPHTSF